MLCHFMFAAHEYPLFYHTGDVQALFLVIMRLVNSSNFVATISFPTEHECLHYCNFDEMIFAIVPWHQICQIKIDFACLFPIIK